MANTNLNATIELVFNSFAISAAAFIMAYFLYHAANDHIRVRVGSELCLVYHKPRLALNGGGIVFANQTKNLSNLSRADRNYIHRITKEFDDAFNSLCNHFSLYLKPVDQHLIQSYNSNGDVAITYPRGNFR